MNKRALLVLISCFWTVTAFSAGLLRPQDCNNLASEILELHATNRDDKEFIAKFQAWTIGLFTKGAEIEANGGPRIEQVRYFIAFYLSAKLVSQYALDHRQSVGEEQFARCQELTRIAVRTLLANKIPISIAAGEVDAFRRPFMNSAKFRLRSL